MKKKVKILMAVILTACMSIGLTSTVYGTSVSGNGSSGGGNDSNSSSCNNYTMKNLGGSGSLELQAIRITVVDKNGSRVSKSIDLANNYVSSAGNLNYGTINLKTNYNVAIGDKKTRNEIINGGLSRGTTTSASIIYWSGLPTYYTNGGSTNATLKNTFINIAKTTMDNWYNTHVWGGDFASLMDMIGYDIRNVSSAELANHYLLIEPIAETRLDGCPGNYYYGTGTEIFKMALEDGVKNTGGFRAIARHAYISGEDAGGLINANSIIGNATKVKNNALSRYGLASMHIWMSLLRDEPVPETCIAPSGEIITIPAELDELGKAEFKAVNCPSSEDEPPEEKCKPSTKFTNGFLDSPESGGTPTDPIDCENVDGRDGTSITVEDTPEWECIYDTQGNSKNTYDGSFYQEGFGGEVHNYCNVTCRESINYLLPKEFATYAGTRFYVGTSNNYDDGITKLGPITVTATATCKTAPVETTSASDAKINYEKFVTDYTYWNNQVQITWDAYQAKEALIKSESEAKIVDGPNEHEHACTSTHKVYCCKTVCEKCMPDNNGDGIKEDKHDCGDNCEEIDKPEDCKSWEHGTRYYTTEVWEGPTVTYKGNNYKVKYTVSSDGQHGDDKPNHNSAAEKAAYEKALKMRNEIIAAIKKCVNFQKVYNEVDPKITFVYSDPYYKQSYNLESTNTTEYSTIYVGPNGTKTGTVDKVVDASSTMYYNNTSDWGTGYTGSLDRNDCGNELEECTVSKNATKYPTITQVIQTTVRTFNYELSDDAYKYIDKQGIAYVEKDEDSDTGYIESAYRFVPVSYNLNPCDWNRKYYLEFYYRDGTPNLFGTEQKFFKYQMVTAGSTSAPISSIGYQCPYDIIQEIMEPGEEIECTPSTCNNYCYGDDCIFQCSGADCAEDYIIGGSATDLCNGQNCRITIVRAEPLDCPGGGPTPTDLNVIYRPISLGNPFPGENGNGRDPGANWRGSIASGNGEITLVNKYITNNRGVEADKVYDKTPMYEFVLNSENIRRIRNYNKTVDNDYNDFDLSCNSDTKNCKSGFLKNGYQNGYFKYTNQNPSGGSCLSATVDSWESCRN